MIFELWSNLDSFEFFLYSCSHYPEDGHVSGRKMLVTIIQ